MAEWENVGRTDGITFVPPDSEIDEFEESLMKAMMEPLDTETTMVRSWGGVEATKSEVGRQMAKKVSAHATPVYEDGVWVCASCESESGDRELFEEAGAYNECAKTYAASVGAVKTDVGRYVAGASARQDFERATKAVQQMRDSMKSLGLTVAELGKVMQVMVNDLENVDKDEVLSLAEKYPEVKEMIKDIKWPKREEDLPLAERQWHKNLMNELNHHYSWGYTNYTFMDYVIDGVEDEWDFIWHDLLRRPY